MEEPDLKLLQHVYAKFAETGQWPPFGEVDRQLYRDSKIDVREAIGRLVPRHLSTDHGKYPQAEERLRLTFAGLCEVPGTSDDRSRFLAVVRFLADIEAAYEPGKGDPADPLVTSDAIRERFSVDPPEVSLIGELLYTSGHLWSQFGRQDNENWTLHLSRRIRQFEGVDTAANFLAIAAPTRTPESMEKPLAPAASPDSRKVFVVHGRNKAARDAMFDFLRAVGLQPIEWSQAIAMTGVASPYIGDVLDVALANAQAVVILMTPDEIAYLRSEYAAGADDPETQPATQARPNVLFEAGLAIGRNPDRSVLVELGDLRPFSDVAGRHSVRMSNDAETRKDLAQRLQTAGCAVDLSGADWLQVGDFTPPPPAGQGLPLGKRVPGRTAPRGVGVDARYHDRGDGGRLEIINRGSEPLFDVDVEVPDMPGLHILRDSLPVTRLPAGKSFMLHVSRSMAPHDDYFDVIITARTADGDEVREEAFVSLVA